MLLPYEHRIQRIIRKQEARRKAGHMRVYRIVIKHAVTREVATPEKYGPIFDKEIFTDLAEALDQMAAFCDGGYDAVIQPSYEDGSFQDVYRFIREVDEGLTD